jgi:hypothetical protein
MGPNGCCLQKDSKAEEDAAAKCSHSDASAGYKDTSRRTALCSAARARSLSATEASDWDLSGARRSRGGGAHGDDGSVASVGRLGSARVVGTISGVSIHFLLRPLFMRTEHWSLTGTCLHTYSVQAHSSQHTACPTLDRCRTAVSGCTA